MKNRIRIESPIIDTRAKAEALLGEVATLTIERNRQKNELDGILTTAREQFEGGIGAVQKQIDEKAALLEVWASSHPEEFPKDRKSLALLHGVIGFRTGTPKLGLITRKWTWETVLEAVGRILPNFVRNKPEVDREAIIAQRDELAEFLPMVGLKVTQAESFFIEPNLESVENRVVVK